MSSVRSRQRGESKRPGKRIVDDDRDDSPPSRPPLHGGRGRSSRSRGRPRGDDDSYAGSVAGDSVAGSVAGSVGGRSQRSGRSDYDAVGTSRSSGGALGDKKKGQSAKERFRALKELRARQEAQRAQARAGGSLAASGGLADAANRVLDDELRAKMEETHNLARGGEAGDPEVHVIGEIVGGEGFESGCACKWVIQAGDSWKCLEGNTGGQTHVIYKSTVSKIDVWAHPIDVHYVAGSLDGWPRILLQVWKLDSFGRHELQGYGFVHIPSGAGSFDLEVPTWRPVGDTTQEMSAYFVGGVPQLKDTDLLYSRATDRKYLVTTGSGRVHIHVDVILKHMDQHGVEW